ncbi:mucin-22 [Halyomorpha halys]|uniref:mucin-22 n=1 Tax=Halyomorpha halys TaxID=286706 RepID=UPI0006D4F586|nr:cell wall protein DAN4-like [Halyomorpha halys]
MTRRSSIKMRLYGLFLFFVGCKGSQYWEDFKKVKDTVQVYSAAAINVISSIENILHASRLDSQLFLSDTFSNNHLQNRISEMRLYNDKCFEKFINEEKLKFFFENQTNLLQIPLQMRIVNIRERLTKINSFIDNYTRQGEREDEARFECFHESSHKTHNSEGCNLRLGNSFPTLSMILEGTPLLIKRYATRLTQLKTTAARVLSKSLEEVLKCKKQEHTSLFKSIGSSTTEVEKMYADRSLVTLKTKNELNETKEESHHKIEKHRTTPTTIAIPRTVMINEPSAAPISKETPSTSITRKIIKNHSSTETITTATFKETTATHTDDTITPMSTEILTISKITQFTLTNRSREATKTPSEKTETILITTEAPKNAGRLTTKNIINHSPLLKAVDSSTTGLKINSHSFATMRATEMPDEKAIRMKINNVTISTSTETIQIFINRETTTPSSVEDTPERFEDESGNKAGTALNIFKTGISSKSEILSSREETAPNIFKTPTIPKDAGAFTTKHIMKHNPLLKAGDSSTTGLKKRLHSVVCWKARDIKDEKGEKAIRTKITNATITETTTPSSVEVTPERFDDGSRNKAATEPNISKTRSSSKSKTTSTKEGRAPNISKTGTSLKSKTTFTNEGTTAHIFKTGTFSKSKTISNREEIISILTEKKSPIPLELQSNISITANKFPVKTTRKKKRLRNRTPKKYTGLTTTRGTKKRSCRKH